MIVRALVGVVDCALVWSEYEVQVVCVARSPHMSEEVVGATARRATTYKGEVIERTS